MLNDISGGNEAKIFLHKFNHIGTLDHWFRKYPKLSKKAHGVLENNVQHSAHTLVITKMLIISGEETPSSASLDNSAAFLEGLDRFPSMRKVDESLEYEENYFMEGLEFPDIGGDQYHSSTESLNLIDGKRNDSNVNKGTVTLVPRQPVQPLTSSQQSGLDESDFEVLDRSEAEGMAGRNETEDRSSGNLTAVSSYIGKWLGY